MAHDLGLSLTALLGQVDRIRAIVLDHYVSGDVGLPTLEDIVQQLCRPGRDPRAQFEPPAFRDDVTSLEDLREGMVLEGVITNLTDFGAFVDVGVHQDGLVHVSQLSDRFIKSPREAVKVGDRLRVRVLAVDLPRRRISLSAKSGAALPLVAKPHAEQRQAESSSPRPRLRTDGARAESKPKPQPATGPLRHNPFQKLK